MRKILIIIVTVLLFSCAGGPSKPDWIQKHPTDPKYYIGIGFSNTGIEGEDRELARKAALGEMASSISTSIKGELEVIQQDSSDGDNFNRITSKITENINHSLEGVSIYDSYYSQKDGYWVYIRFSKAEFELQKQRLRERVLSVIHEADTADISKKMSAYVTAMGLLYESPYIASIKDEAGKGILLDMIESKVFEYVTGIEIKPVASIISAEPGKSVKMGLSVEYDHQGVEGIPVLIISKSNAKSVTIFSGESGKYNNGVDLGSLSAGENQIVLQVDTQTLNIPENLMKRKLSIPQFSCIVKVDQLKAQFKFHQNGGTPVPGVQGMTQALFSKSGFPLTMTSDPASLAIDVELVVEDFPRFDEKSLYISQARLIIKLNRDGNTVYTYETKAQKDGGITMAQSYERTVKKLIKSVSSDSEYLEGITRHLGVE